MTLAGIVEIAVYLDSFWVYEQKLPGSLRLAFSVHRKKDGNIIDKVQAKQENAEPFRSADRSIPDEDEVAVYCNDIIEGEIPLLKATPYILTDSFFPKISSIPSESKRKLGKIAFFRIELPCHPFIWSEPITLKIDLLMKPQVLNVKNSNQVWRRTKIRKV